jgi:phenylacetate-CoA ligase
MLSLIFWHGHPGFRRMRRTWRELEQFSALDSGSARENLSVRLLAQIRYFGTRPDALPEWREAARIRDPSELWRIWGELPILTKDDLRSRFSPSEMQIRCNVEGIMSSTGGSTGEPTSFIHNAQMRRVADAVRLFCWHRIGWRPGVPIIRIWGSERDIGRSQRLKNRIYRRIWNGHLVDGYRLDGGTVDRVLEHVRGHRSVVIYGFTSMLEFVAREILERGEKVPPGRVRTAWNGGEMLLDSQSHVFQKAFGVPILNLYGGRELSTMAFQPRPASSLTVLRPFSLVEIVDDQGRPVPPGEMGRLIWTSTVCRGTPFLRYDIGDLGAACAEDQDESGVCRLTSLHGRHAGLLTLPDGKTISALVWNHLFKEFPEVAQFQVVLKAAGDIDLRLKGRRFSSERDMQLRGTLLNFLGPVRVGVNWMDSIPLTPQGKLLQVVREAA